jgi:peptidoglycan hydrolase CwlO-like protein
MKKKIILLIVFIIFVLILSRGLVKKEKNSQVDLQKKEEEIQAVLANQEELAMAVGKLADQAKIEEALAKNSQLKENLHQALVLNQIIIDNLNEERREVFIKRKELLETNLRMLEKMEECLAYIGKDKKALEKCQLEFTAINEELEGKGKELQNLSRS